MMLAQAAQQTAPVNWFALGTVAAAIVAPIMATLVAIATYQNGRTAKREAAAKDAQQVTSNEIKTAVDNLATVLLERLETKERVNAMAIELAKLGVEVRELRGHPAT